MKCDSIVFGIITCVVGIIAGIFVARYYNKLKKPLWTYSSETLISKGLSKIPGLAIEFKGKRIDNLTSYTITFWNDGKKILKAEEVVENIVFSFEGINSDFSILSAEILGESYKSNHFKIDIGEDKQIILLNFDYIDHKEGVVFKVYANSESAKGMKISGKVLECPQLIQYSWDKENFLAAWFIIFVIAGVIGIIIGLSYFLQNLDPNLPIWAGLLVIMAGVVAFCLLCFKNMRLINSHDRIPNELKKYDKSL